MTTGRVLVSSVMSAIISYRSFRDKCSSTVLADYLIGDLNIGIPCSTVWTDHTDKW